MNSIMEGATLCIASVVSAASAATYLLRERGFNAVSVKGGVRDWPYELERGEQYLPGSDTFQTH